MDPYQLDMQWSLKNMNHSRWFCKCFSSAAHNIFGKTKSSDYQDLVKKLLASYHLLGGNISIKLHSLKSHLDKFPDNLSDVSDEQGERFHQDIKIVEDSYQGCRDTHTMADYCWSSKQDCPNKSHDRKSLKRKFLSS